MLIITFVGVICKSVKLTATVKLKTNTILIISEDAELFVDRSNISTLKTLQYDNLNLPFNTYLSFTQQSILTMIDYRLLRQLRCQMNTTY